MHLLRSAAVALALIGTTGACLSQTPGPQPSPTPVPPTPQPSPSPAAPNPDAANPYADPTIRPMVDKALDHTTPTPPVFKSPLNKGNPGPGEAEAFSNLVLLSNKMWAARYVLRAAEACGSKEDKEKALANVNDAIHALNSAEDQYVRDYSSTVYPPGRLKDGTKLSKQFESDISYLDEAVDHATTYRAPAVKACPSPRQDTTGNPPPKPEPAPPPPPKSGLKDILGHVSIGVGVGIGGDRRDRDDDRRRDDDREPADRR